MQETQTQPKAFILHLRRAVQRQEQVEKLRAALPGASEIIDAVDGAALSQSEVDQVYSRFLHRPRFSFALNRAEIGVFLSHRAAWRKIIEQNLDYAMIFEDDASIDAAAFARTCDLAAQTRPLWTYALAPAPRTRVGGEGLAQAHGLSLLRPKVPPLRAIAQFVSRDAASRLLAASEKFDRPIDTFLQMSWVTGVELLAFSPSGVSDVSGAIGGTTIQRKNMALGEKLRHEIARPIYRAQVRAWHAFARRPK